MSWIKIWAHLLFSTKNREPFLNETELRNKIFKHIKQNAEEKEIWLDNIGGHNDHIHCLISLGKEQSISKVAQLIKGESSHWINENKLTRSKFIWQDDYWAVGVSESHLKIVRHYIQDQENHHKKVSFDEEIELFMKKYGWKFLLS